jgi:hypothetical protein
LVGAFSFSDRSVKPAGGCSIGVQLISCQLEAGPSGTALYPNLFLAAKAPVYFVNDDCTGSADVAAPSSGRFVLRVFALRNPGSGSASYYVQDATFSTDIARSVLDVSGCHLFSQPVRFPLTQLVPLSSDPLIAFSPPFSFR